MGDVKKAESTEAAVGQLRNQFEDLKRDVTAMGKTLKAEIAERVTDTKDKIVEQSKEWVKDHPAATVGIIAGVAASVGFILGLLAGRSRS